MEEIVLIENLKFKYDETTIFDGLNLKLKPGSFTTIIGPNGSGKSTLVKLLLGLLKTDSLIKIDGLEMNEKNLRDIHKNIGVVFENPDNQFVGQTVLDDLVFTLENQGYKRDEIDKRVNIIANKFLLKDILHKEPHLLSSGQKQIVSLAAALINGPKILILDEALSMIEKNAHDEIFRLLRKMHRESNLTIINITHDTDEAIYGDDVIVLKAGHIAYSGPKGEIFLLEKELHKLGLEIPFMVALSLKLIFYGLIDEIIFDMDEMVNKLWT